MVGSWSTSSGNVTFYRNDFSTLGRCTIYARRLYNYRLSLWDFRNYREDTSGSQRWSCLVNSEPCIGHAWKKTAKIICAAVCMPCTLSWPSVWRCTMIIAKSRIITPPSQAKPAFQLKCNSIIIPIQVQLGVETEGESHARHWKTKLQRLLEEIRQNVQVTYV